MPHIHSQRLRLRAAESSDLARFLKWVNDPEVCENLEMRLPISSDEEESWYAAMLRRPAIEHVNVIEIRQPSAEQAWFPIGNTSFMGYQEIDRSAEIGIMLGEKDYWNKGYGTEAMETMLRHGFETLNLHRIWLRVYSANLRGQRAYQKAGFIHEGTLREARYQNGNYQDVHIMSVLRPEWEQELATKGASK